MVHEQIPAGSTATESYRDFASQGVRPSIRDRARLVRTEKTDQKQLCPKVDFGVNEFSCLVRVTSWIVPWVQKTRTIHEVTLSNTNQNTPASNSIALRPPQRGCRSGDPGACHRTQICRPLRGLKPFLDCGPGVCSLRSPHPRLYAVVRSAHSQK